MSPASILLYLGLEAAIFRSGWYNAYPEPNSTAGEVEYHLLWLRQAPRAKVPEVLVVGDSRIAEGFSTTIAELDFLRDIPNRIARERVAREGRRPGLPICRRRFPRPAP